MTSLRVCLVSPFALQGAHPVAEHVRGLATALAGRGHRVTVLAPSPSTRALRSGRRRLRALAAGDGDALLALEGEPLVVAVTPAAPLRQHGRRRGVGLPVAAGANVALAVAEGGFDVVDAHEPLVPGIAAAAVRRSPALTVATFHSAERSVGYPISDRARDRYRARVDALVATSAEAAARAVAVYPGDYTLIPDGIDSVFHEGSAALWSLAVEWAGEGRAVVRAMVGLVAATPAAQLTLVRGDARRGLRPYVPAAARGRVHARSPRDAAERAAELRAASVLVAVSGDDSRQAWEARACGCVVVAPAPAGGGEPDGPGLVYGADQPALAAAAAGRLLEDGELRAELRERSLAAAAERRFPRIAERVEDVYLGVRKRRRPPRAAARPAADGARILADLHMHTNHSHDCATPPADLLDHCIAEGLGAVAITDHNEISGALEAAELGRDITVIVGEEVKSSQGEVIGLYLRERVAPGMPMADTIDAITEQGGLVYMPHPFDRLHTIPDPATLLRVLDRIDIFEVYNSRLLFEGMNDDALRFAAKYNLIQAAGSDAHVLPGIGTALNRIPPFSGPEEFLLAMRQNEIVRRPKSLLYLQGLKWVQSVSR